MFIQPRLRILVCLVLSITACSSTSSSNDDTSSSAGGAPSDTTTTTSASGAEGGGGAAPLPPDDPEACLEQTNELDCLLLRCHWTPARFFPPGCDGWEERSTCLWYPETDFLGLLAYGRDLEDGQLLCYAPMEPVGYFDCGSGACECSLIDE